MKIGITYIQVIVYKKHKKKWKVQNWEQISKRRSKTQNISLQHNKKDYQVKMDINMTYLQGTDYMKQQNKNGKLKME